VSKERALRRARRESEAAAAAAERARRRAKASRRSQLRARVSRFVPPLKRPSRSGLLAAKRRRTVGLIVLAFAVTQALTWVVTADWATRLAVVVVSLFAVPVIGAFVL
jgi:hypothetical protein